MEDYNFITKVVLFSFLYLVPLSKSRGKKSPVCDKDETRHMILKVFNNGSCWSLQDDFRLFQIMETLSTELNLNVKAADYSLKQIILDLFLGKVSLCSAGNKIFGLQTRQFVESGILEDYCSVRIDEATLPIHNNKSEIHYKPEHILAETVASGIEVLERISQQNASIDCFERFSENGRAKTRGIDPYDNYFIPNIVGSKEWTECTHKKMTVPDKKYRKNSQTHSLLDSSVLPSSTEILDAFSAPEEVASTLHRKPVSKAVRDHVEPTNNNLIINSNKPMEQSVIINNDPETFYVDQNKKTPISFYDARTADETPKASVDIIKCNSPALKKAEVEVSNSSQIEKQISDHATQASFSRTTVLYNDDDHDSFMKGIQGNSSLPSGLFGNIAEDDDIANSEAEKRSFPSNPSSDISSKTREEKQSPAEKLFRQEKLRTYKHDEYQNKFVEKDDPLVTGFSSSYADNNKKDPLFALFFDEPPPDDFDIIFKNSKTNESEIEENDAHLIATQTQYKSSMENKSQIDKVFADCLIEENTKQNEQVPRLDKAQVEHNKMDHSIREWSLGDECGYDTNNFGNSLGNNTNKRSDNLFYGTTDLVEDAPAADDVSLKKKYSSSSNFSDSLNAVESKLKCSPPPLLGSQYTKNNKLTSHNLIENRAETSRQVQQTSNQNEREKLHMSGCEYEIYPSSTRASDLDNPSPIYPESMNQNKTLISVSETKILPNLTKDRPKIQAYRRPPTRRARKHSYLRSLDVDDLHHKPEDSLTKTLNAGFTEEDLCTIRPPNLAETKSDFSQYGSASQTKNISVPYCSEEERKISKNEAKVFSNIPNNDDWLLQNNDDNELKAENSKRKFDTGEDKSSNSLSKVRKSVSLFFDDPEGDEYLFNVNQKPSSVRPVSLAQRSESIQTQALFNSDDEDDLFLVASRKVES